ncbi:MAG: hypothetical protein NC831_08920 [Candidatus Omnitrophica bacterium]|nr:hypothetical protein [Candidatus Omnitrophota bacterium]
MAGDFENEQQLKNLPRPSLGKRENKFPPLKKGDRRGIFKAIFRKDGDHFKKNGISQVCSL